MNKILYIYRLYYDGFKNMNLGKTLWKVIIIKIIIILVIIKGITHDKSLGSEFKAQKAKSDFVYKNLKEY